MWDTNLPPGDQLLRQGDLIIGGAVLARGQWQFEDQTFQSSTAVKHALVLDHCCTIEQKRTVTLCAVGTIGVPADPEHRMHEALANMTGDPEKPFTPYQHPLDSFDPHLPAKSRKRWVAKLEERFTLLAAEAAEFDFLQQLRVARMTPLGRAHLRYRLATHFGRLEDTDADWLTANGFDVYGKAIST